MKPVKLKGRKESRRNQSPSLNRVHNPQAIGDGNNTATEEIHVVAIGNEDTVNFIEDQQIDGKPYTIDEFKPYLRPMSSMTDKEKEEFKDTFNGFFQYFNHGIISDSRVWDKNEAVFVGELSCSRLIDWLNAHNFDYRRLIPMGLALEAPEGMYKVD